MMRRGRTAILLPPCGGGLGGGSRLAGLDGLVRLGPPIDSCAPDPAIISVRATPHPAPARGSGAQAPKPRCPGIFGEAGMTIGNSSAADGFIQRLPKDLRFYLVHGADEGLTHERSKAIVGKVLHGDMDPLRIVRLEGDVVARDPGVLAD